MQRENYYFFCKLGNKTIFPKYLEFSNYDFITMNGIVEKGRIIIFDIFIDLITSPIILYFFISYKGNMAEIFTSLGFFSHIPPINNGYYISENLIIKYFDNRLILFNYSTKLENFLKNYIVKN